MSRVNAIAKVMAKYKMNTDRVSQSSLICMQPIVAGNSSYEFPLLDNVGAQLPEEIRLALQDVFFCTTMAVCFSGTLNFAGPPAVASRMYFYNTPFQLAAAAIPLNNLYLGNLSYSSSKITYTENWDLSRHYSAKTTQLLGVAGVNGIAHQQDERSGNLDGFFPMDPAIVLNGGSKLSFRIEIPNANLAPVAGLPFLAGNADAMTINIDRIAIIARGYLAQNASNVNPA